MLTYHLDPHSKTPLYEQLYRAVRADIMSGTRALAEQAPAVRQSARQQDHGGDRLRAAARRGLYYLRAAARVFCAEAAGRPCTDAGAQSGGAAYACSAGGRLQVRFPHEYRGYGMFPVRNVGAAVAQRAERILRPPAARDRPVRRGRAA